MTPKIIFDFDSTFIQDETLDEIAKYKSKTSNLSDNLAKEIIHITNLAMKGSIEFSEALKKRIKLLSLDKTDIVKISEQLKTRISPSFIKHKDKIKHNSDNIYIISGGFKEIIYEVVKDFGINKNQIFANEFKYSDNKVAGIDNKNPLSSKDGKIKALESLKLEEPIYVVGDGYTDFEMKYVKEVKGFICYVENINRPSVSKLADYVAKDLDDTFRYIDSNG